MLKFAEAFAAAKKAAADKKTMAAEKAATASRKRFDAAMAQPRNEEKCRRVAANGVWAVRTSRAVNRLRPLIMERKVKGFQVTALHLDSNGVAEPMLQPFAALTMTKYIESSFENCWVAITGDGAIKKVQRYCRSMLVLNAEESMDNAGLVYNLEKGFVRQMFRVLGETGADDRFFVRNGNEVTDLISGEVMSLDSMRALAAKHGLFMFDGSYDISSPGQLKRKVLVRFGQYLGNESDRKVDWDHVMNMVTCGGWAAIMRGLNSKKDELSFKEMANVAVRMALNMVVSAMNDCRLDNFAVYPGKFERKTVVGADGKPFNFMDGTAPFATSYLAACVQDALGENYSVFESAVLGYVFQCRPFWVCKGTAVGFTSEMLWKFFCDFRLGKEMVTIYRDTMTEAEEAAWEEYCLSSGKSGEFAGKIIVVLRDHSQKVGDIQAFWDFNFQKTVFNLKDYETGLNALSMAHAGHTDGVWSSQLAQSVFCHDFESGKEMLNRDAAIEAHELWAKTANSEGRAPSIADFTQSRNVVDSLSGAGEEDTEPINVTMAMKGVAPHFAQAYFAPEYKQSVNKGLEGMVNRWNNFNVRMDGEIIHTIILPDPVAMITGYTVLSNKNAEGITETIGANFRNVSHEEIVRRIEALPCSEELKRLAIEYVSNLAPGVSYVPATQEASMLGEGWDFDGDSWYIVKKLGIAIRYPKTHSEGYFRISVDCQLPEPLCVNKDC